jgi:hypothetical protein
MRKQPFIYCLAFLVISAMAYAHADQTGSITGVVRTPDGEPLAGVIVLLKGPALIIPEIEVVSNKAGVYSFSGLSPGTYELSFFIRGMERIVHEGVAVSADAIVTLDVNLKWMAPSESVVVEAEVPDSVQTRTLESTTPDYDFFAFQSEYGMMDRTGIKIEQGILFTSISFIMKSLPFFSLASR